MAKNIVDATIGKPLRAYPDYLFHEVDLDDSDNFDVSGEALSDEFYPGKVQNRIVVVVEAVEDIVTTVAGTDTVKIEYMYGEDLDKSVTLFEQDSATEDITTEKGEIARFTPTVGMFESKAKIKITTDGAEGVVDVYPIRIS